MNFSQWKFAERKKIPTERVCCWCNRIIDSEIKAKKCRLVTRANNNNWQLEENILNDNPANGLSLHAFATARNLSTINRFRQQDSSLVTDTVVEKSVKMNKMSKAYRTKLFQLGAFVLVRVRIFIVMFSNILKINRYFRVSGRSNLVKSELNMLS